jgi:predicted DNA-binding WGR domain protein
VPDLRKLLAEYADVRATLDRATEIEDEERLPAGDRSKPFPPASEKDVAAYEAQLGLRLPPSYREFLLVHNGWQRFWGDTWIAGVSGKARTFVAGQAKRAVKWVASDSGWDPRKDHVIGANDNGGFLVLAPEVGANGERKILDCVAGVVIAQNTFASFVDLVEKQLRYRGRDIKELPAAVRKAVTATAKPTAGAKPSAAAKPAAGRRFECTVGGANKFWTVAVAGKRATFTWGPIGAAGQTKTKAFADVAALEREVAKLVAEKTRKGYKRR